MSSGVNDVQLRDQNLIFAFSSGVFYRPRDQMATILLPQFAKEKIILIDLLGVVAGSC